MRLFQNEVPWFDLRENEPLGGTHFNMNSFARRQVLTQKQQLGKKEKRRKLRELYLTTITLLENYNTSHFCSSQKKSSEKCPLWQNSV